MDWNMGCNWGTLSKEGGLHLNICAGATEFLVTPLPTGQVCLLSQGLFEEPVRSRQRVAVAEFDQDSKRVLELLINLRRKRLQKLNKRMGDLKYLASIGLDAKDAQLAKEKAHVENRIAHWDVKLTTAKFLHDRVHAFLCTILKWSFMWHHTDTIIRLEKTTTQQCYIKLDC